MLSGLFLGILILGSMLIRYSINSF
jgi:hypothetical protein